MKGDHSPEANRIFLAQISTHNSSSRCPKFKIETGVKSFNEGKDETSSEAYQINLFKITIRNVSSEPLDAVGYLTIQSRKNRF